MTAKTRKWIIALLVAFAVMCISVVASASVSVSVSPSALASEGEATFSLKIKNDDADSMENIKIKSSYDAVSFQTSGITIAEGGEHTFVASARVSEEMLDTSITFTVSWMQGGEEKTAETSVKVKRATANSISVRRTVSSRQASPGETITSCRAECPHLPQSRRSL